jgi:transcriptional regulator with PAS, ATPase and Fis domain
MKNEKRTTQNINRKIRQISEALRELRGKRSRRKPREEDGRRKYDTFADSFFLRRYEELGRNQTALARELGVSRQAVSKRLRRASKEARESALQTMALLEHVFGKSKR